MISKLLIVLFLGFSSIAVLADEKNQDLCVNFKNASHLGSNSYRSKIIYNENYDAFPYATKIGNSIIGIFSTGAAHAKSDKQIMFRSDDGGDTFRFKDFFINDDQTYDFSLVSDLLNEGKSVDLKIWNLRKNEGLVKATTTSKADGYSIWSTPKNAGAKLYRTGYNAKTWQTALLESLDGGITWKFKSVIAPTTAGRQFSEADIINTYSGNWIAYIREDKGKNNNLYRSVSTNNGATWSIPIVLDPKLINGRQPNLTKLDDSSIILITGDRTGKSGYAGGSGDIVYGNDTTGITIFRSTDNGTTWSIRKRVSPIYSTDGGQPFVVDLGSGKVFIVWYARDTIKGKPSINSCTVDINNL